MMTTKLKGVDKTFKELRRTLRIQTQKGFEKEVRSFARTLRDNTPVDTGEARDSWEVIVYKDRAEVVSDAAHMPRLNEGYSRQAPSNFIERVALRFGRPVGIIVQVNES